MNNELYALLKEHAKHDKRSLHMELEMIVALYFDEIGEKLPITSEHIKTTPDKPSSFQEPIYISDPQ